MFNPVDAHFKLAEHDVKPLAVNWVRNHLGEGEHSRKLLKRGNLLDVLSYSPRGLKRRVAILYLTTPTHRVEIDIDLSILTLGKTCFMLLAVSADVRLLIAVKAVRAAPRTDHFCFCSLALSVVVVYLYKHLLTAVIDSCSEPIIATRSGGARFRAQTLRAQSLRRQLCNIAVCTTPTARSIKPVLAYSSHPGSLLPVAFGPAGLAGWSEDAVAVIVSRFAALDPIFHASFSTVDECISVICYKDKRLKTKIWQSSWDLHLHVPPSPWQKLNPPKK